MVQAIRHRTIPASLNCEQDSEYVHWQDSPFYVNKQARPWTSARRIGAVSAFGMSGTNAHMVVRSYEGEADPEPLRTPFYLLALSAKNPGCPAAEDQRHGRRFWKMARTHDLRRISFTLLEGRWHFRHRCAIVIQDRDDAIQVWRQVGQDARRQPAQRLPWRVPRGFTARRAMHELALDLLERCRAHGEQPCLERRAVSGGPVRPGRPLLSGV